MLTPPVVITGIGAITALGNSARASWEGLLQGRSGVRTLSRCAPVSGYAAAAAEIDIALAPFQDRLQAYALRAASEAMGHAGFRFGPPEGRRLAIVMGCSLLGAESLMALAYRCDTTPGHVPPWLLPAAMANGPASQLAGMYKAEGLALTINTACCSGMDAIGLGRLLLQSHQADIVLCGAAEAQVVSWVIATSGALRTMAKAGFSPEESSRPWDAQRTGMVIGEGAACVVLERAGEAGGRGLASIDAYASACAPVSFVTPDLESVVRCLGAVRDTANPARQQGLVVHGSGTLLGDHVEMAAIAEVFGLDCPQVHAWATKGAFGHPLGAGCAIDIVMSVMALREHAVPPTRNLYQLDPQAPPVRMAQYPVYHPMGSITLIAMGFGGHHAAMRLGACL